MDWNNSQKFSEILVPIMAVLVSAPFARNKGRQVKSSETVSKRLFPNIQQNQPVHNTLPSLFSDGNWDFDRISRHLFCEGNHLSCLIHCYLGFLLYATEPNPRNLEILANTMIYTRSQPTFSVKRQTANSLGFASYLVSVATTQLCCL